MFSYEYDEVFYNLVLDGQSSQVTIDNNLRLLSPIAQLVP